MPAKFRIFFPPPTSNFTFPIVSEPTARATHRMQFSDAKQQPTDNASDQKRQLKPSRRLLLLDAGAVQAF
jgi:hypothetical protein